MKYSIVFKTNLFTNKTLKCVEAILEARDASQVSYQSFGVVKNSVLPMKAKNFNFFASILSFNNFSQNTWSNNWKLRWRCPAATNEMEVHSFAMCAWCVCVCVNVCVSGVCVCQCVWVVCICDNVRVWVSEWVRERVRDRVFLFNICFFFSPAPVKGNQRQEKLELGWISLNLKIGHDEKYPTLAERPEVFNPTILNFEGT